MGVAFLLAVHRLHAFPERPRRGLVVPDALDWHRHGFYEVLAVETGSGTHEIDFKDYTIEPGQFFVLHPNQVHRLRRADLLAGRVLIFDASFLGPELRQSVSEHFYTGPCLTAGAVDYATLMSSFGSIQAELARPDQTVPLLASLLQTLFLQLLRARQPARPVPAAPSDFDYRLFVQFKSQLDQAVPTAGEVHTYADRLAVTGRKLNEVSRRFTGVLSGYNVEDNPRIAIGQKLYTQEQLVRQSGIPFTFLRACSFMQNYINYYPPQPDGNFYMPVGDQKMNFVDVRDIARVAVLALTQPGHQNQVYRLATVSHTIA